MSVPDLLGNLFFFLSNRFGNMSFQTNFKTSQNRLIPIRKLKQRKMKALGGGNEKNYVLIRIWCSNFKNILKNDHLPIIRPCGGTVNRS